MNTDLGFLDLIQQAGNVLIILALGLRQLGILADALDGLPAADLNAA